MLKPMTDVIPIFTDLLLINGPATRDRLIPEQALSAHATWLRNVASKKAVCGSKTDLFSMQVSQIR
jgi:hypothetical protein